MKKQIMTALILAAMLTLNGCGAVTEKTETETTTTVTAVSGLNIRDPSYKADECDEYPYVHGEDGYFCLEDELPGFVKKQQDGGTCWIFAGAASMQTAYEKENGKPVDLDPMELAKIIYSNDKEEGYFATGDPKYAGGWQWSVTNSLSRGFGDHLVLKDTVVLDPTDYDQIKETLRTRGGVAIETFDQNVGKKGWFGKYFTMNDTESFAKEGHGDHDVTIIGWDDHFPKDYFREPASQDGAWIVYNSNLGADDYYYISYDTPMGYAYSHNVTDKYSEVLSYDAGTAEDLYITAGDSTSVANVFHESGKLAAVGTYNHFDSQDITIEVYDADFKKLLYSQDATLDFRGYHTIELDTPVEVDDFAVAVTYSKGAPVEGESIGYDEIISYKVVSESGQSYVLFDGGWTDLTSKGIKKKLGSDFEPNNCCIKALVGG